MAVNVDSDVFLVFVISHCMLGCSCFKVRSIGWPLCLFLFFSSVNLKFNRNQTASVKSAWYKSRCVIFHLTTTKDRERERECVCDRVIWKSVLRVRSCFFKWFSVTQQGVDLHVALQKCCWSTPLQQAGSKIRKYRAGLRVMKACICSLLTTANQL